MPRHLTLAAIRMDAAPTSVVSRLARAESLIVRAAAQGTQIAVLPELFNTGMPTRRKIIGLPRR